MRTQLFPAILCVPFLLVAACDTSPDDNHTALEQRLLEAGAQPGAALDETLNAMVAVGYDDLDSIDEPMTPADQEALALDLDEALAAPADAAPVLRAAIGASFRLGSLRMHYDCGDVLTFFVATVGARIDGQASASSRCGALRARPLETYFDYDFAGCSVVHVGEYVCR